MPVTSKGSPEPALKSSNWEACSSSSLLSNTVCHQTYFTVPSSHDATATGLTSPKIQIYSERFRVAGSAANGTHVIFIGGGPGATGRSNDKVLKEILQELPKGTTVYTFDHRGLGKSTPLDPQNRSEWHPHVDSIIKNAPFPLEHTTLTNSSLDIGVLAELVKKEGDLDQNGNHPIKVSLIGVSYGAHLAVHVSALHPNLFHSIYLFGTPNIYGLTEPECDKGLIENCAGNSHCKSQMGGKPEDIRVDLQKITNPNLNECTKIFFEKFPNTLTKEHAVYEVLLRLSDLLMGHSSLGGGGMSSFHSAQLAFAFIRTTSQCTSPNTYREKVLTPLKKYFHQLDYAVRDESSGQSTSSSSFNTLVNSLILLDKRFDFNPHQSSTSMTAPEMPSTPNGLFVHSVFVPHYWGDFVVLNSVMKKMKKSQRLVLSTSTTKVYMIHGDLDLNTTKAPAKRLFNEIVAPHKRWLGYRNLGHTGLSGPCRSHILMEGLFGADPSITDKCFAQQNSETLDWTFSGMGEFSSIWNTTGWTGRLSSFHKSQSFLIVSGVVFILFLIALFGVLHSYRRSRKRKDVIANANNTISL